MKPTYIIIIALILLIPIGYYGWSWGKVLLAKDYQSMLEALYSHSVPTLSVNDLGNDLESYMILDTRAKREWEVSHLPNAIWVNYPESDLSSLEDIAKDKKILVYCSVGYRSEKIGEKLLSSGYTNIYNLHGGIFSWANAGLPLVEDPQKSTKKVHGYSPSWGKWITNEKIEKIY